MVIVAVTGVVACAVAWAWGRACTETGAVGAGLAQAATVIIANTIKTIMKSFFGLCMFSLLVEV